MSDTPNAPAGWYDDPEHPGQQRWWDGTAWGGQRRPEDPATAEPPSGGGSWKPAFVILAIVAAFGLLTVCGDRSTSDRASDTEAYVMCQQFVEDRLKAPATAGFPLSSEAAITGGPRSWTVRAHVDSENGFGAMVRTRFKCDITYEGDDEWRLNSLSFED